MKLPSLLSKLQAMHVLYSRSDAPSLSGLILYPPSGGSHGHSIRNQWLPALTEPDAEAGLLPLQILLFDST